VQGTYNSAHRICISIDKLTEEARNKDNLLVLSDPLGLVETKTVQKTIYISLVQESN